MVNTKTISEITVLSVTESSAVKLTVPNSTGTHVISQEMCLFLSLTVPIISVSVRHIKQIDNAQWAEGQRLRIANMLH